MKTASINLENLLKKVSRSFYLTLRILPQAIKPQLGLAYLLARATDTIADTEVIDVSLRQAVLSDLRTSVQTASTGGRPTLPDFSSFMEAHPSLNQSEAAERFLLQNFDILLEELKKFKDFDRREIRKVLEIITHGQAMDLARFCSAGKALVALKTDEELDQYTYEVAGCVGEFWTRLCRVYLFPTAALDDTQLLSDAVLFGKGLQLVNILRDLPKDLQQGRCYIPKQRLSQYNLKPADLLDAGTMDRFRPLYNEYLQKAEDYLRAGWRYTTTLPFRCVRVRLACAWPILIGVQTVERLRHSNVLDYRQRVKISRSDIWRLILNTLCLYPYRKFWNRLFSIRGLDQ
jgi:farnesyl-diphosphate farnesyltransferase